MPKDLLISVSTGEVTDETEIVSIKRAMYNMIPWLNDYCKDRNLLNREYLEIDTLKLIEYFVKILKEEGEDIHDFAGVKIVRMDKYDIRLKFLDYRYE